MKLSDELFSDIRRGLNLTGDAPPDAADNANSFREEVCVPIEVETFAAKRRTRRKVTLTDFGRGGLRIVDDRPWGAGERLTVFLPAGEGRFIPLVCTARNPVARGDLFLVGMEFTAWCELSHGGLAHSTRGVHMLSWREENVGGGASDRRSPRSMIAAFVRMYPTSVDDGMPRVLEAKVVDASPGGLGMMTETPLTIGTRASVELTLPGLPVQRHVVQVVACRPMGATGYRMGVKYVTLHGILGTVRRYLLGQ